MLDMYILDDDHQPVKVKDVLEWGRWIARRENRIVRQESIGPYLVSTVFLGLDHNFNLRSRSRKLILFETMVFSGPGSDISIQERCSTWDEALEQHEAVKSQIMAVISA